MKSKANIKNEQFNIPNKMGNPNIFSNFDYINFG